MSKQVKTLLWLDDFRDPFEGNWLELYAPEYFYTTGINLLTKPYSVAVVWVKHYYYFIKWINDNGLPDMICFDHDLGGSIHTGYDCAKWLIDYCISTDKPLPKWNIQSANPVGKENIRSVLLNFEKHQRGEV